MAAAVDMTVLGNRALIRKLEKLPAAMQKRAVRPALRRSAKRVNKAATLKLARIWRQVTGVTLTAFKGVKVRSFTTKRGLNFAAPLPTRSDLGISPDDRFFYPQALEYGTNVLRGRSWLRSTADEMKEQEFRKMGSEIGIKIEDLARSIK